MNMVASPSVITILLASLASCQGCKELKETCVFIEYAEKHIDFKKIPCIHNDICNKTFHISFVNIPPYNLPYSYTGYYITDIEDMLIKCCGYCVQYTNNTFQNLSEVTPAAISNSHFVYPILATPSTTRLYGFYYLPYFISPSIMFVTKTDSDALFQSIMAVYPVVIVCLLLAIVSGFIAWIVETWANEHEFPRPFLAGWFDGFWWSFISMTTVGYGDKTPKSIPARLFSVIWIFIGIIAFGILTGSLTGYIIEANSPPPADMMDKYVGVLRYRDYDAYVVSQNGGHVTRNDEATDFESDVLILIKKLKKKQIQGFVLDNWALAYASKILQDKVEAGEADQDYKDYLEFFFKHTTRAEKAHEGKQLSYGMLIKRRDDFEYFKDSVKANEVTVSILTSMNWIKTKKEEEDLGLGSFYSAGSGEIFSPKESYFRNTVIAISVMIGLIFLFGLFYELKRKSYRQFPIIRTCRRQSSDNSSDKEKI